MLEQNQSMPEIEITAMSAGPYGIGHLDGQAVMVPGTSPGDLVRVTIVKRHHDYVLARLDDVLRASSDRRMPPCTYLPRCGGCGWQQIAYSAQVRIKGELIATEIGRALGIEIDSRGLVEAAPAEFGYRSRIRLQAGPDGGLGFHQLGTNEIVEIDRCIVAADGMRIPRALASALGRRCSEIEVVRTAGREVLIAHLRRAPGHDDIERARRVLADDPQLAGIVLRNGRTREVLGDAVVAVELEPGLVLQADADVFTQVNHAQNRKLVALVMEWSAVGDGTRVLDLFCGAGNFSIPAARRGAQLLGVDADALSIEAATRNAQRLALDAARFVAMKAAEIAQFLHRAGYHPELAILDPPRTGARDLMEPIAKLRPPRVLYVSCDIATLARDLRTLASFGYQLERLKGLDFFPNTHHAEIVASMVLT